MPSSIIISLINLSINSFHSDNTAFSCLDKVLSRGHSFIWRQSITPNGAEGRRLFLRFLWFQMQIKRLLWPMVVCILLSLHYTRHSSRLLLRQVWWCVVAGAINWSTDELWCQCLETDTRPASSSIYSRWLQLWSVSVLCCCGLRTEDWTHTGYWYCTQHYTILSLHCPHHWSQVMAPCLRCWVTDSDHVVILTLLLTLESVVSVLGVIAPLVSEWDTLLRRSGTAHHYSSLQPTQCPACWHWAGVSETVVHGQHDLVSAGMCHYCLSVGIRPPNTIQLSTTEILLNEVVFCLKPFCFFLFLLVSVSIHYHFPTNIWLM